MGWQAHVQGLVGLGVVDFGLLWERLFVPGSGALLFLVFSLQWASRNLQSVMWSLIGILHKSFAICMRTREFVKIWLKMENIIYYAPIWTNMYTACRFIKPGSIFLSL